MKAVDEWWAAAACRGHDLKLWFPPPTGEHTWNRGRRICATCPVALDCLNYADHIGATHGMYGGLTPDERAEPDERCGTEAGFQAHRAAGTTPCAPCKTARRLTRQQKPGDTGNPAARQLAEAMR